MDELDSDIVIMILLLWLAKIWHWSIWETVTFLDLGFHETKQEKFDGNIKDRPTSLKDIKKLV